jgi:hypothetical protein
MTHLERTRRDIEALKASIAQLRAEFERAASLEQRRKLLPHMRWCADELAVLLGQLMSYDIASLDEPGGSPARGG